MENKEVRIKIEINEDGDFDYSDEIELNLLVSTSVADDTDDDFSIISTWNYSASDDPKEETRNCLEYFKEALESNKIIYDESKYDLSDDGDFYSEIYDYFKDLHIENFDVDKKNYTYFDRDEVIELINDNKCSWSTFAVDTCFEKAMRGSTNILPGNDRVPKNINFIDDDDNKYYAKIENIIIIDKKEKKNIKEIDIEKCNACIAFEMSTCQKIIIFVLGYMNESSEDRNIRFYTKSGNIEKIISKNNTAEVLYYNLDECKVEIKSEAEFANQLSPYLNYYSMLLNDLSINSDQIKLEVNIDFLRENYRIFADLIPDEDLITLPINGNPQKLKSISVLIEEYSGELNKYDFYEANISVFSKDDLEVHYKSLVDRDIKLPKKTSLVLLDIIDLYDKDKFLFRKLLNSDNTKKCFITNNIEGERTRLRRIISGIENSLCGKVVNNDLINSICTSDIRKNISSILNNHLYSPNIEYIEYLKKEYHILSKNQEQLETIDKIIQMKKNNVDVLLVQGPPGTGKTELILALAKELIKYKFKTLITSNVHVACDNVVERLKNNKDIVLKRYTTIKGDQYEKEFIENQKRYVENQVLAGFMFNNNPISSLETYELLCSQRDELLKKRNQMIKTKSDYDIKLESYNKNKKNLGEEIKQLELIANKQENSKKCVIAYSNEINIKNNSISNINNQLNDIYKNKTKLEFEISQISNIIKEKEKDISVIYNENEDYKIKIEKDNQYLYDNESSIEKINNQSIQDDSYLQFLEKISISDLKNTVYQLAIHNKQFPSQYHKKLLDSCIDEVTFFAELKEKLETDYSFWNQGKDFNLNTLEYVLFTVANSKYSKTVLDSITKNDLIDIYMFYKLNKFKKKMISIFPFVKNKGHNYEFYRSKIAVLNRQLKQIQFNYKEYFDNCVQCVVNDEKILLIKKDLLTNIEKSGLEIQSIKNQNLLLRSEIKECESQIEFNYDTISKKKLEIANFQNEMDSMKVMLSNRIKQSIEDLNSSVLKLKKEIDEIDIKKTNELSIQNRLLLDNKSCKENIEILKDKISKFEFENSNLIENYDNFINRFNIDIIEINKKIDKFEFVFSQVEKKVQSLLLSGWSKEDAFKFIFNYVTELENIIEADETSVTNYFEGKGNIFSNMFLLSEDNDESLISMTTSQVASLLNSTDSNELTFDYAIIDEASKCKFEDIIISLPRVKHLVLIGDFMQLDPLFDDYKNIDLKYKTLISSEQWDRLNKSSFGMLLSQFVEYNTKNSIHNFNLNPCVAVMKKQYRMNKGIFNIIEPIYSIHEGFELIDEKQMTSNDLKCIEIKGNEIENGTSFYNLEEGNTIVSILHMIKENIEKYPSIKTIGIITGYKAQQIYLLRKLNGFKIPGVQVQIGTFDRFQGREYDLVLVSLVRTIRLGFTNNIRRMNVAFSRAKNHLIVLGNFTALANIARKVSKTSRDEYSSADAKENDFVVKSLIPKLDSLKKEYVSLEETVKEIAIFLREEDYE